MSNPYGQPPFEQQQPYGQQPYGQQPAYPQGNSPQDPNNLDVPLRGATIGQAVTRFFKKYATFSGRASRSEFWWWTLANFVIVAVLVTLMLVTVSDLASVKTVSDLGPFYWIIQLFNLAILVPSLALSWRRLHDTNRSGLWYLISLVPLVGGIVLLVFYASGPNPAGARFDKNAGGYPAGAYAS